VADRPASRHSRRHQGVELNGKAGSLDDPRSR
jgi:hypothetical protein